MANPLNSFKVPYQDKIIEKTGMLTRPWEWFFRDLWEVLYPLGQERSFNLANNQSSAADVTNLKFNKRGVSQATVEFLIQRVTTSTGATELVESGSFLVSYLPTSDTWSIDLTNVNSLPHNSGVTLTITSSGQVQYTTTNITGTDQISRIVWRARTLRAKSSVYSDMGTR